MLAAAFIMDCRACDGMKVHAPVWENIRSIVE